MLTAITNRFNTFLLVLLVLMAGSIIALLATRAGAGPLDPPAAPAPSLPQMEPRMPIPPVSWSGTFPIVISQPGSYFLTRSLTVSGSASAIQITASDVALDLNGFTLTGSNTYPGVGVEVKGVQKNLTVRNGNVRAWWVAVDASEDATDYAAQSRFEDLQATDSGAGLLVDSGATVRRVIAQQDSTGIVVNDQGSLYAGGLIEDSLVSANGLGVSVNANNVTVRNCVIDSTFSVAVDVFKAFDVIEGNTIQGTNTGPGVNLVSGSTVNTVTHNIFSNLHSGAVTDSGIGNRVGPPDAALTGSQPWSNAGS